MDSNWRLPASTGSGPGSGSEAATGPTGAYSTSLTFSTQRRRDRRSADGSTSTAGSAASGFTAPAAAAAGAAGTAPAASWRAGSAASGSASGSGAQLQSQPQAQQSQQAQQAAQQATEEAARQQGVRLAELLRMPLPMPVETAPTGIYGKGHVARLKENFGFLYSPDFADNIFFHFSRVSPEAMQRLGPGLAVSFVLQRDRKTKRIVAADLEVTNDPIETEVFIEQQLQGMIVYLPGNAPQNNAPAAASGSEFGRPPPRSAGRIDFKYEGEVFHASFDSTGIHVDSPSLGNGDIVSFYILMDKRLLTARAVEVMLVQRSPEGAFRGVVRCLKPNFGLIERADQVEQVFFFPNSWTSNEPLEVGTEVSFDTSLRNNKPLAINIKPLPKGTVQFYSSISPVAGAAIVTDLNRRISDPFDVAGHLIPVVGGSFQVSAKEGPRSIPFRSMSVAEYPPVSVGDLVSYLEAIDARDNEAYALNVSFLKKAERGLAAGQRETGFVVVVKEGFGYIRCAARDVRVFFHFSQLPGTQSVKPGTEVSFVAVPNNKESSSRFGEALRAIAIGFEPGSVIDSEISRGTYTGIIRQALQEASQKKKGKAKEVSAADRTPGLIEIVDWKAESAVDGDSSAPQSLIGQVVPYWMQDIRSTVTLKAGDEVSLRLVRLKATQELIALDVQLAKAHEDSTERMIGPISDIKENFGFVELPSAKGEIFFHFSELQGVQPSELSVGDFVSYVHVIREGKKLAGRVQKVADEEVETVEVLEPGTYKGRISRALKATGRTYGGRIEILESPAAEGGAMPGPMVQVLDQTLASEGFEVDDGQFPALKSDSQSAATGAAVKPAAAAAAADAQSFSTVAATSKMALSILDEEQEEAGANSEPSATTNVSSAAETAGPMSQQPSATDALKPGATISFGIRGQADRHARLLVGDIVQFRVATDVDSGSFRAVRIKVAERDGPPMATGTVEALKDGFGFLDYVPEGDEAGIFFHFSNVVDNTVLALGDTVSFDLSRNPKSQKYQAINVKLVKRKGQRPVQLAQIKPRSSTSSAGGMGILRQPTLPDEHSRGFTRGRGRSAASSASAPGANVGGLSEMP